MGFREYYILSFSLGTGGFFMPPPTHCSGGTTRTSSPAVRSTVEAMDVTMA